MRVKHINNAGDMMLEDYSSYYALFERPFKCTCCCLARPEMTAKNMTGSLGKVYEPCTCCDPMFHVMDTKDKVKWKVTADYCQCGICCRNGCGKCSEVLFPIHSGDKTDLSKESSEGYIKKLFTGIQELVSDADSFELGFPNNATPEEKMMLIATVLMIDFRFYEDNGNNQRRHNNY
jgi:hypothetical protein